MGLWGTIVDVHKGLASAVVPGVGSWLGQQEANEANKDLWTDQKAFSLEMWNKQNEYNSPAATMKRLETAGLNPNMAYGEIGGGRAGAVSVSSAPDMKAAAPSFALADFAQVVNMQEQNKLIKANASKVIEDARLASAAADTAEYELGLLRKSGMSRYDQTPGKFIVRKGLESYDRVSGSIDRSSLWQSVLDSVSNISQALHTNVRPPIVRPKGGK